MTYYPSTDAECTRMLWRECLISTGVGDHHLSIRVGTDISGTFEGFNHDLQEMITVDGSELAAIEYIDE